MSQTLISSEETVEVTVHRKPKCLVELEVKTTPALREKAKREATKAVRKEVVLPGFRKGKAPEELVRSKYAPQIEKESHDVLANLTFEEAQKQVKIPLLNNRANISYQIKKGAEGVLSFTFETEPEVPQVDRTLFARKAPPRVAIGETQVEEAIRQARFFFANWKEVDGRGAQEGDYVLVDLDKIEGEKVERVFHKVRFEVSDKRMAAWMKGLIVGMKVGEEREGMSAPDAGASEEEKKGFEPKKVKVTLAKIEEAELPEVNDEFAKKLGAPNVEEMRKQVTAMLEQQAEEKERKEVAEEVNHFLIEKYPFELPQSLVESEKRQRIEELKQRMGGKWDNLSPAQQQERLKEIEHDATHAIALYYLSKEVVKLAGLSVTEREVQQEAVSIVQQQGARNIPLDQIPKEVFALAFSKTLLGKAQKWIADDQKS